MGVACGAAGSGQGGVKGIVAENSDGLVVQHAVEFALSQQQRDQGAAVGRRPAVQRLPLLAPEAFNRRQVRRVVLGWTAWRLEVAAKQVR